MATLYRSYRPRNFKEVVNQNHIKITLQHEIGSGRIAHAYLFCGPRGIGKTTIARVFAKAVNCEKRQPGEHEPCNDCPQCAEIGENRSLDIVEIDAASHTGVDNVRDNIISAARVAPSRSRYKVFIIDEVHMLSISAFNALLKVLEEPPQNVIFILCTTEVHKIPATIISRCQRFDLVRISIEEISRKLAFIAKQENIEIDKSILDAIARRSEGHMRDAESLLGQIVAIGGSRITEKEADLVIPRSDLGEALKLIQSAFNNDAGAGIALINKLIGEGVDLSRFTADTIEVLRKALLLKLNPGLGEMVGIELGQDIEARLNEIAAKTSIQRVLALLEKFLKAKTDLKNSFIVQLPLEMALAEFCAAPAPLAPAPSAPAASAPIPRQASPAPAAAPADRPNPAPAGAPAAAMTKDEILAKWNELLISIKRHNHSLSFILRVCEPRGIDNNRLCLAFKYKFHKDRIMDPNIKSILENALLEVYRNPLVIEAIVDENIKAEPEAVTGGGLTEKEDSVNMAKDEDDGDRQNTENPQENGNMIDNLLKAFGGKVVG